MVVETGLSLSLCNNMIVEIGLSLSVCNNMIVKIGQSLCVKQRNNVSQRFPTSLAKLRTHLIKTL